MSTSTSLIGVTIGTYEIQALLGRGGMATVYRAFDHNLQRPVAIKVLSAATAAQPGFVERFRQEARIIASLRHPNIVHVYDLGEYQGTPYMVQELLPGPTLAERLRTAARGKQPLAREEVVALTRQLAAALDTAHAAGIIHRDVKPSNALWNNTGALVLTDFGIAKNTLSSAEYTQTGLVIGTPDYLAPEQAQGLPLSPASDIYALGVVVYEMITGQVPFASDTPMRVVLDHIQTPPPALHTLRPDLPTAVELVVQRALAKDPAARFQRASDLATALDQAWSRQPRPHAAELQTHEQATIISQVPTARQVRVEPATQPFAAAQNQHLPTHTPTTAPAAAPKPRQGGLQKLLPVLGGLLLLILLGRAFVGLRNPAPESPLTPNSTAILAPSPIAAITSIPLPATAPVAPPAAPPVANDPLPELRQLINAGIASGQAGEDGDKLLEQLDDLLQALAENDPRKARNHLRDMQKQLREQAREEKMDQQFANQVQIGISNLATRYGLDLPQANDNDNDDDDND